MNELRDKGATLLYVSHAIESVKDVCDHALWLSEGKIVMKGSVDTVCDSYMEQRK